RIAEQPRGEICDERGLLGRLSEDCVACSKGRRYLSGEYCQREVPWADANHNATPMKRQFVALAGRPRQWFRPRKATTGLLGVIAKKVNRLPQVSLRILQGLPRFANQERHERRCL